MYYTVDEAFEIAVKFGVISHKKAFYRWLSQGVIPSVPSETNPRMRKISHNDLFRVIEEKLSPFTKELLRENIYLKEQIELLKNKKPVTISKNQNLEECLCLFLNKSH